MKQRLTIMVDPVVKLLLLWYSIIFVSTEIFSLFHILNRENILITQAFFLILAFVWFKRDIVNILRGFDLKSRFSIIVVLILLLTFIQGLMSAPSTTDAMVYHLTKVMYWIQEKTVSQDIIRNTHDFKGPFGEYIVLHLYNFLETDRLVFLSQWLAFAMSVYLAGVIAVQLQIDNKFRNLVRLFVATLPMAVMQATSSQVDMVWSTLIIVSLHIVLVLLKKFNFRTTILLGITLGLGIFTKAYFVLYTIIPLGLLVLYLIKTPKKLVSVFIVTVLITTLIMLRLSLQNIKLYGNLIGGHPHPAGEQGLTYINQIFTPAAILSGNIRHLVSQIPFPFVNSEVMKLLVNLHRFVGVDINDPRITCCERKFSVAPVIYPQEDIVANPLHLMLIIFTAFILLKKRRKLANNKATLIFILSVVALITFNSVFSWAPGNNRLIMPSFIIGTITSVLLIHNERWGKTYLNYLTFPFVSLALFLIILNVSHPYISYSFFYERVKELSTARSNIPEAFYLKPRIEQYFNAEYFWYKPYDQITNVLTQTQGQKQITLDLDYNFGFEYPLWVMIKMKKINFKIIPKEKSGSNDIIISVSEILFKRDGYKTQCFEAPKNHGYACISEIK